MQQPREDGQHDLIPAGIDQEQRARREARDVIHLINTDTNKAEDLNDPLQLLEAVAALKENTVVLLKDFHLFLSYPNPILLRKFKDTLLHAKTAQKLLIILGCRLCLPPELEHELTVVEFSLPGKVELRTVLGNVMESVSISNFDVETSEKAVEATSGLTTIEAENALSLAYVCRSAPSNRASSPLKKPQR